MDGGCTYASSILLDVDGSSDVSVDSLYTFFVGGNSIQTGADCFLGEAIFFLSIKDSSLVASPCSNCILLDLLVD